MDFGDQNEEMVLEKWEFDFFHELFPQNYKEISNVDFKNQIFVMASLLFRE